MEIKNDTWKDQQRQIFELSRGYREVWKRIEMYGFSIDFSKGFLLRSKSHLSKYRFLVFSSVPCYLGHLYQSSVLVGSF